MIGRGWKGIIQVLEITTGEVLVCDDFDLSVAELLDDDLILEILDSSIDLDFILKELLEAVDVEDLV